ncbi:crotonobetainyl-CoA hydratase [Rhodopseudomonas rhenobacensis]|uniref:Crotonobetainyl-CoA hydratase n=2 Tax=Rhodopseudomonas rhenobacensis TaxID=87461 RepID=A0A7W8DZI8_9BRAD|nr:crotonobetainyl-CoA hydratase [Rhodopseudomonas rhenobacensis]
MAAALDAFAADDNQWVAIVTGDGDKAFCAGQDLKSELPTSAASLPPSGCGGMTSRFDLDKPVIAAVNGIALGGGFELALACDLIVASSQASFALPEPRVGLAALAGGIQRLCQEIGMKRAMSILLTGRRLSAHQAAELGLVAEVVEANVLDCAKRWAAEIISCAPLSVRATKRVARDAAARPLSETVATIWDRPEIAGLLASADAAEGRSAFAQKRPPRWQAR